MGHTEAVSACLVTIIYHFTHNTQRTFKDTFLTKSFLCVLCAQQRPLGGIVICPIQTNKTSNSIPSVIKGYLDRNINISLKLNQMLLHGGAQDSEESERKTEKQGRYFTQESESVPRPQHFETFIPSVPSPSVPPLSPPT